MALPLILLSIMALGLPNSGDVLVQAADHTAQGMCEASASSLEAGSTGRRAVIDITHAYRADLPKWQSSHGLGSKLTGLVQSMADGDVCNVSELKLEEVHSGTHVDAPGHYVQEHYEAGLDVASLSLDVLIGS